MIIKYYAYSYYTPGNARDKEKKEKKDPSWKNMIDEVLN